jgi:SAM-dependent methyltransferase
MMVAPIYEAYAAVYDAIEQGRFGARLAEWSLQWLAARGAYPRRVLDLACGSGDAALMFAAAGCAVVGMDRSRPMLEIARGKARDAGYTIQFFESDIRALSATDDRRPTTKNSENTRWSVAGRRWSFDLATCFYDSLNYLVGDGDLDRVFAGVAVALRPGGYLIFDINTAAEYATWDERDVVTYDGRDCIVYNRLSYDPATRLGNGRVVWFVRELERWWRGEEMHTERAWSDAEIGAALNGAGLSLVARLGPDGTPATGDALRVVYVARRVGGE